MKNKIFSHIQSLRALSVLFVFLYHTNIPIFSNGYLGVDIFFVISGFVITKSIFDNCEKKIINLKNFYIKRAKRIIPNLFFIVVFTYLFYLLFGPPDLSLFKEMFFALLGLSNFYYLTLSGDYFNNIFDDPLGHTWSLGVEQQFYLIYPIILFFFSMKGKG
jgi:peptidoglycan/LPS O-acetylase OafA/YrhL